MRLYKLKIDGHDDNNARVLAFDNGTLVLFSYEDPVSIAKEQRRFKYSQSTVTKIFYIDRHKSKITQTTYKHISSFIKSVYVAKMYSINTDSLVPVDKNTIKKMLNWIFRAKIVTKETNEVKLNYKRTVED